MKNTDSRFSAGEPASLSAVEYIIENAHRPVIIAGNGPSLTGIDRRRIPENPVILRINNFFFEERYFLGRRADIVYVAGPGSVLDAYIKTLLYVVETGQYDTGVYLGRANRISSITDKYFPLVDANSCFTRNSIIHEFMSGIDNRPNTDPTSGMLALLSVISLGFRDIYLTGIDFYTGENMYSFRPGENHSRIVGISSDSRGYNESFHNMDIDMEVLSLAKGIEGVSVKSLSPGSPIGNYIPAADIVRENPGKAGKKPDGYTRDFLLSEIFPPYISGNDRLQGRLLNKIRYWYDFLLLHNTDLFDGSWYVEEYPDVRRSGLKARAHYLLRGCAEGRNPGPQFDTRKYYRENPDVLKGGMNALIHYIRFGRKEGRITGNSNKSPL